MPITTLSHHCSSPAPLDPPHYRASEVLTESSIYSRPSKHLAYDNNPTATSPWAYEEISPPSSPEPQQQQDSTSSGQPRRFRSMRDVSPMDEKRGNRAAPPRASNIPVLRKAPPVLQTGQTQSAQKFWGGKVAPDSKVKWDEYSGEPTASNSGRTGSVSPNTYAKGIATSGPQVPAMGYHVSVSGPKRKESRADRMGRLGARPPPVETAKHEPWSRATGRSQIAPALKDQPSTSPLQLPKKVRSPTAKKANANAQNVLAVAASRGVNGAETGSVSVAGGPQALGSYEDVIKPTVPLKVRRNTPTRGLISPTSPNFPKDLGIQTFPSQLTTRQKQRNDSPPDTVIHEQALAKPLPAQQRGPTPPQDPVVKKGSDGSPDQKDISNSGFSWTTFNSTTTYQHSPPPSPPNVPSTTPARQRVVTEPISAASAATSILSRRRHVPQTDRRSDPIPTPQPLTTAATTTTTITSDGPGTATMASSSLPVSPSSASTHTTSSTTKALPLPPTSLSAADHIAVLESAMEDLRIRRSNVYRLLNDLNTAAPPNPLITDFKRARLVEARKRGFEDELSEIKREEHEVGLKLHRAWKKREREDPNVGSAIWIRRVTG
ncbi:hypothetical protein ACEQ8H_001453 [Pleosporales sp. CAS-2024a]